MIKTCNLTVYSKRNNQKMYLLKDITFHLNKGDSLGIIGLSGSGKSTLAKALLNIFDDNVFVEKGDIFFDNIKINPSMRGKDIAILFQNPNSYLNPLMKVGKQISEMLRYHYNESKSIAKHKTINLMEKLGIEDASKVYDYYPYEISGGMQQRVCLCISLICEPKIIILDECTSYLDKETKDLVLKYIKDKQKEQKLTLILISHDFKEIYSVCNKIAVMEKGKMVELGTKKEMISNFYHPHTLELFLSYINFYNKKNYNLSSFINDIKGDVKFKFLSDTHYVNGNIVSDSKLKRKIKEELYEYFNDQ